MRKPKQPKMSSSEAVWKAYEKRVDEYNKKKAAKNKVKAMKERIKAKARKY